MEHMFIQGDMVYTHILNFYVKGSGAVCVHDMGAACIIKEFI